MTDKTTPQAALIAALALLGSLPSMAAAQSDNTSLWEFTGRAFDINNDDVLLYEERHQVEGECVNSTWQPMSHQVKYFRDDEESAFATKTLSYTESSLRPSFEFHQSEFDERMVVANRDDRQLDIAWKTNKGEKKTFETPVNQSVVADAGFDNFVRRSWPMIQANETVDFRFLAPTRGEHYAFVLEQTSDSRVSADLVLEIRPSGFVTRFLVDPIILGYGADGALTDYVGLTNVRENADQNFTAHIRYQTKTAVDCSLTP
ncbi:MAG: hypothetical protein WD623_07160 [Marinobacter sp.]|uniref:hypothetical protein n=1 Tax=Marinobacter sp. TaxID=50741 RepID=UPI0034A09DAC